MRAQVVVWLVQISLVQVVLITHVWDAPGYLAQHRVVVIDFLDDREAAHQICVRREDHATNQWSRRNRHRVFHTVLFTVKYCCA